MREGNQMDKEAAVEQAAKINKDNGKKSCPLSGTFCRSNCVVYIKAKAVKSPDHTYRVVNGYCNAYSLIGP